MPKLRITVLKRAYFREMIESHIPEDSPERLSKRCPYFKDGQEFILENCERPEDFCDWAWTDIQRDAVSVALGVGHPWMKEQPSVMVCCTDGKRPVTFLIEQLREEE